MSIASIFQSTHPLRGATGLAIAADGTISFQSTHPLRGATAVYVQQSRWNGDISIHAPLAGCDLTPPPLAGGITVFQSTHPLRGATIAVCTPAFMFSISIHAPLAGCDHRCRASAWQINHFNPRTPCGVRHGRALIEVNRALFQSTHPLRGATRNPESITKQQQISIHAPLAGCDYLGAAGEVEADPFQSTHPLRGATIAVTTSRFPQIFQSTHPLRGATRGQRQADWVMLFQSTHPLRGATSPVWLPDDQLSDFNPRTPCGVRPSGRERRKMVCDFNPRTPCGVRRAEMDAAGWGDAISIHAPLAGCDPL